jgi:hypothetical protein
VPESEAQTDSELLKYITYLEGALNKKWKEVAMLHEQIDELWCEKGKYRHLWMTEHRYSNALVEAGAELSGGFSQVQTSQGSSPYYRCMRIFSFLLIMQLNHLET